VALRYLRVRAALWPIVPGLALIVGWHCYLHSMHAVMPSDFARPSFHLLADHLSRISAIVGIAFAEITEINHWSVFWLLTVVAIVYLVVTPKPSRLLLTIGILGPVIVYPSIYVFSAWPNYTAHVTSSLPRLFLQVMPLA